MICNKSFSRGKEKAKEENSTVVCLTFNGKIDLSVWCVETNFQKHYTIFNGINRRKKKNENIKGNRFNVNTIGMMNWMPSTAATFKKSNNSTVFFFVAVVRQCAGICKWNRFVAKFESKKKIYPIELDFWNEMNN